MPRKKFEQERLEGTYQIIRIKKIERMAYIPQLLAIATIFSAFLYFAGAQFKPLYIPFFFPLLIVTIWLLALSIQAFIFRLMEIRYRKSESAKFLMASRSMKKAYSIILIAIIVFIITITPLTHSFVEDTSSIRNEVTFQGEETIYFTSRGRFDFIFIDDIIVELIDTENWDHDRVDVFVISQQDYYEDRLERCLNNDIGDPKEATYDEPFVFNMQRRRFDEYYLLLVSEDEVTVSYSINTYVSQERVYPFTTLAIAFATAFAIYVYVLYPIKKKYAGAGIYQ